MREVQWSSHAVGAVHGQHAKMPSCRTVAAYLAQKVLATTLKSGCLRMAVKEVAIVSEAPLEGDSYEIVGCCRNNM